MEKREQLRPPQGLGPKSRKYFRFRYRILLVAFLFIAPSQATFSGPEQDRRVRPVKACLGVATSYWTKGQSFLSTLQDEKEVQKLLDCGMELYKLIRETDWKEVQDMLPKEVKALIQDIPKLLDRIKDLKGLALNGGLVFLSVYFAYKSTELYVRAENLELNFNERKQEFKFLKYELNRIMHFAETEITPQLQNGVTVNFFRTIESLIEKLDRFSNRLIELHYLVNKDIKQDSGDKTWAVGYSFAGGVVCVSAFFSGNAVIISLSCGFGVYTVVTNYLSYNSLGETLEESELLKTDIQLTRGELAKFRTYLEAIMKRKSDLNTMWNLVLLFRAWTWTQIQYLWKVLLNGL